jgi:SOS-response transcriptional repressor LexA
MDVHSIRLANLEHLQHGLERKDLATKIGVDYGQLGHYYTGVRNIGSRIARKIEQAFGKPHGWLDQPHPELRIAKRASTKGIIAEPGRGTSLYGSSMAERLLASNVEEVPREKSRLPLISWVSAGLKDEANDPYAPGNAEAWIEFDSEASGSAFCLRVRGNSMVRPDGTGFPDGCVIAVEPKRRPRSGDFVVVRFNDSDEATFKQYWQDGPLKMLRPLNTDYPVLALGPDARLVGTVFEKRMIEKF